MKTGLIDKTQEPFSVRPKPFFDINISRKVKFFFVLVLNSSSIAQLVRGTGMMSFPGRCSGSLLQRCSQCGYNTTLLHCLLEQFVISDHLFVFSSAHTESFRMNPGRREEKKKDKEKERRGRGKRKKEGRI